MKSLYLIIALICLTQATLPDCTGCWTGTSGPCKQANTVCHDAYADGTCPSGTTACGGSVPTKYACSNNVCSESSTGTYDSQSACQAACSSTSTKYTCNNGNCDQSSSGQYDTLSDCQSGCAQTSDKIVGAYYANWARYRSAPYTFTASSLSGIIDKYNRIYYGFQFFCPPNGASNPPYWAADMCQGKNQFDLIAIDPKDKEMITTMNGFKSQNGQLKLIAAIGGWTFPSEYFSIAVSTDANRKQFANAIKSFAQEYNLDGVNFDWEYPCSAPREDVVKIECSNIKIVIDGGGNCPSGQYAHGVCAGECNDGANFLLLLKELKSIYGGEISTVTGASPYMMDHTPVKEISEVVDYWQIMNYDFFVSDIKSANVTAPNQNMFDVPAFDLAGWSASGAVNHMISSGAPANKLLFGVAFYGHHWYVPGITDNSWQAFDIPATEENLCCGPLKDTYGGAPGKGSSQCGSLMFSEIEAAGFETYYDEASMSAIGYLKGPAKDGTQQAGTWVSYMDEQSVHDQVNWAMDKGMAGSFTWDCTMDSIENGQFTWKLTKQMYASTNNATEIVE